MSAHHDRRLVRLARNVKAERAAGKAERFAPRKQKRRARGFRNMVPTPSSNPRRAAKNASGLSGRQWVRYCKATQRAELAAERAP